MTTCFCVNGFAQKSRSLTIVTIENQRYYIHTVGKGDTFYSLSKLYDVPQSEIINDNPQTKEGLKTDQVLKIGVNAKTENAISRLFSNKRKQSKIFNLHTVSKGETAYSVCKFYGLDLNVLMMDNPSIDPTKLSIGEQLRIRKSDIGSHQDHQIIEQIDNYVDASNSVTDDFVLHAVEKGETLYSLSKEYHVEQSEIEQINGINAEGLKLGMMIKLPRVETPETEEVQIDQKALFRPYGAEVDYSREQQDRSNLFDFGWQMKRLNPSDEITIALMLPFAQGVSSLSSNFLDFYQGVLLALEDTKKRGVSIQLNLYNTHNSEASVAQIVNSPKFKETDLIIGPIYEDEMKPAVRFAENNHIAIISPLAAINSIQSPVLYQISPLVDHKYDKIQELISSDRHNVVLISTAKNDFTFADEILPLLKNDHKRIEYSKALGILTLEQVLSDSLENVFVVISSEETVVEEFLARLSSVKNNMNARSISLKPISVVGSSRWLRFQNIDKNLFFKLNVNLVSSYYADRSDSRVMEFDKRYISEFSSLPNLYSYRGYDVTKLFVGNLVRGYAENLRTTVNGSVLPLLQVKYNFAQASSMENNVNDQWVLIRYNQDYTISVK